VKNTTEKLQNFFSLALFEKKETEYILAGNNSGKLFVFKSKNLEFVVKIDAYDKITFNFIKKISNGFFTGSSNGVFIFVTISDDFKILTRRIEFDANVLYDLSIDVDQTETFIYTGFKHNSESVTQFHRKKKKLKLYKMHKSSVYTVAISKGRSRLLATGSYDKSYTLMNVLSNKKRLHKKNFSNDYVSLMLFGEKEKSLFIGSCDCEFSILCLINFDIIYTLTFPSSLYCMILSKNKLFLSGNSNHIKVLNFENNQEN
jgi:WD40 repeat protein